MLVVAFHACDKLAKMEGANPAVAFPVGLTGVDIFFVVSGFIIFVTAKQSDIGPFGFMRKRVIRVVPLYWVLTVMLAAVAIVKPDVLTTSVFETRHFAASMLFIPWQHPQIDALLPLLIPGWTLNYEMAFYAIFAASLFLPKPVRLWALLALLAGLAISGAVVPLTGIMGFYTDPIILEFAAGLLIARAWTGGVAVPVKAANLVALLGFALLLGGSETSLPRIVSAGIPALLIVAGAVFSESRYKLNPSGTLVVLGDASYSIYLSHVIVIPVVAKLWAAAGLGGAGWLGLAFVIAALIASALAGVVLYKLVERPLLKWLSGKKRGGARHPVLANLQQAKLPGN